MAGFCFTECFSDHPGRYAHNEMIIMITCRVAEAYFQAVRPALAAALPVELRARLDGTPHPSPGQVRF